jgi:hypothetical protein
MFDIKGILDLSFARRLQDAPNQAHKLVNVIRLVLSGLIVLVALIDARDVFASKKVQEADRIAALGFGGMLILGVSLGAAYLWELPERIFLFSLPILAHFIGRGWERQRGRVLGSSLIMIAFPLFLVAEYGNAFVDHFSLEHQAGVTFFHRATERGSVLTLPPFGHMSHVESYAVSLTEDMLPSRSSVVRVFSLSEYIRAIRPGENCYIQLGAYEARWIAYNYGDTKTVEQMLPLVEASASPFYDNGAVRLFSCLL